MKKAALCLALVIVTASVNAQDIAGAWSGKADIGPLSLAMVFNITHQHGGYTATMDIPDQRVKDGPMTMVAFARDTLRMTVDPIGFVYTGVVKGDTIEGAFTQRGMTFQLDLSRGGIVRNRPQEPRPPFPYRSEDVVFENTGAGIRLAGTLTMPSGGGKVYQAVVLLTGSGAQNRDEEIFGHKPFFVLADHLTRLGIAVLRFDDRGVGGSQRGRPTDTSTDFATDAAAAIEYLRTRPEIGKIGLAGHSEGAIIAFIAAARQTEPVSFIVSMAGVGLTGEEVMMMQFEDLAASQGLSADSVATLVPTQRRAIAILRDNTPEFVEDNLDSIVARIVPDIEGMSDSEKNIVRANIRRSNSPWMRFFLAYDPAADLVKIDCPVLAVNGSKDLQVRSSVNLAAIRSGLEAGGNTSVATIDYPGLNHLFQTAVTGTVDEYGEIEETFSTRVMDDIAAWIIKTVE